MTSAALMRRAFGVVAIILGLVLRRAATGYGAFSKVAAMRRIASFPSCSVSLRLTSESVVSLQPSAWTSAQTIAQ
jgi:hypothetical protein